MKNIRTMMCAIAFAGVTTALITGDIASAADAAAQAENFIQKIVKAAIGFVGGVAVLFVVYGGFKYVTSSGKPDKLEEAKSTLKYAGFGVVIVLAAYAIVDLVAQFARDSFGG